MNLTTIPGFRPGEKLPNGAFIIASALRAGADPRYHIVHIVLAMWLRGRNDCEYVTWAVGPDGEAYWGRYFGEDVSSAVVDYTERVGGKNDLV